MTKFFYDTKSRTFIELKAKEKSRTTTTTRQLTTDSKPTRSRYEEEGFVNEFSGQIPDFYNLDTLPGRRDDEDDDNKKIEKARQETVDRISQNGNQNIRVVNSDVMGNPSPQKLLTQDSNDELELARQEMINRISRNARR